MGGRKQKGVGAKMAWSRKWVRTLTSQPPSSEDSLAPEGISMDLLNLEINEQGAELTRTIKSRH